MGQSGIIEKNEINRVELDSFCWMIELFVVYDDEINDLDDDDDGDASNWHIYACFFILFCLQGLWLNRNNGSDVIVIILFATSCIFFNDISSSFIGRKSSLNFNRITCFIYIQYHLYHFLIINHSTFLSLSSSSLSFDLWLL